MMRAFLSHSSSDKEFVSIVAKQLGRQYCIYDTYSFETGDDFRRAIRDGLDKSSIFVLFASKEALDRTWVRFEQDEAELRAIKGLLKRPLVFILEEDIDYKDLPEWLTRGRVVQASSPKAVAREIQHYLHESIRDRLQPIFVGRHNELAEAEKRLLDFDTDSSKRIFAIHGLSGIGRRTLAKRIGQDLLGLSRIVVIPVEEGDSIYELAAKTAEHIEIYSNMTGLKRIVDEITASSEEDTENRLKENLSQIVANGELPIFFDSGGLLDNDGFLSDGVRRIIQCVTDIQEVYLNLSTWRKLYYNAGDALPVIPTIRVEALTSQEVERLVGTICSRQNIIMNRDQIKEISEYIGGYPPAAHYAVELIKEYGVEAILADKYPLVNFRTSYFISYLTTREILKKEQLLIISILSYYSPLPLSVLGQVIGLNSKILASHIEYLIDTCIVLPDENGLYALSDPIIEAAQRITNRAEIPHSDIAAALDEYVVKDAEPKHLLSVGRNLFRARRLSGENEESEREIYLISDLIALEIECYHSRDYDKVIIYGLASLESRPDSIEARTYVIRALAQLGRFKDTEEHFDYLYSKAQFREFYFLKGFVARLHGRLYEAVDAYEESIKRGRKGLAVHRELAICYYLIGNMDEAEEHIAFAQSINPDNKYIVDMQIIIAIHQKNENSARDGLELLKLIDQKEFYMHRLSTVELTFGNPEKSYEAAKAVMQLTKRPTFAMYIQATNAAIACEDLVSASDLINELEIKFRGIKDDIKTRLRCRWEIAAGEYKNALTCFNQLSERDKPVHKNLLRDILKGVLSSNELSDEKEYIWFKHELEKLEAELANMSFTELVDIVD